MLHVAAESNFTEGLKLLIDSGISHLELKNRDGNTPANIAEQKEHWESVRLLIQYGAKNTCRTKKCKKIATYQAYKAAAENTPTGA